VNQLCTAAGALRNRGTGVSIKVSELLRFGETVLARGERILSLKMSELLRLSTFLDGCLRVPSIVSDVSQDALWNDGVNGVRETTLIDGVNCL
jgi:hypothetical protein